MTQPIPVTTSKAKAWVALIGGLLTAIVPYALQYSSLLPAPWPAVVAGLVALLTVLGVYHTPNKPTGPVVPPPPGSYTPPSGGWTNPWKRQ